MNAQFSKATPTQKPVLIKDGITRITCELERLAAELKVLNSWMDQMPDLIQRGIAEPIAYSELYHGYGAYLEATDKFTEQMIKSADCFKRLGEVCFSTSNT